MTINKELAAMVYLSKEEIVKQFMEGMTEEEKETIRALDINEMGKFHFSVGMYIRNHYGLWEKENPLTQLWFEAQENHDITYILSGVDTHPNHPDNVSGEILKMVWHEVNKDSPDLLTLVDKHD
jgi:hypothetical protein